MSQFKFTIFTIFTWSVLGTQITAKFWDDLRVTFDLSPNNHFNRMPRTRIQAEKLGWIPLPLDSAKSCDNAGEYNGFRYTIPTDYSLVLMYDINGIISGLQMMLPHSDILSANNTFRFGDVPYFNNISLDGADYFVLTAYFIEPSKICSTGRKMFDLAAYGSGDGVWFQEGPNPENLLRIPHKRDAALASGWSDNSCFTGMGHHCWYRMEDYEATNCNVQAPVFGLYNKDMELHAFGFSVPGTTKNPRFENPPPEAVKFIAGKPAPKCLIESVELSELKIFLNPFYCGVNEILAIFNFQLEPQQCMFSSSIVLG